MFEYCAAPIKGNNKNASKTRILLNNQIVSGEMSYGETKHELIAVICDSIGASPRSEIASEIAAWGFMNFDIASASPLKVMKRLKVINDAILLKQEDSQPTWLLQ